MGKNFTKTAVFKELIPRKMQKPHRISSTVIPPYITPLYCVMHGVYRKKVLWLPTMTESIAVTCSQTGT